MSDDLTDRFRKIVHSKKFHEITNSFSKKKQHDGHLEESVTSAPSKKKKYNSKNKKGKNKSKSHEASKKASIKINKDSILSQKMQLANLHAEKVRYAILEEQQKTKQNTQKNNQKRDDIQKSRNTVNTSLNNSTKAAQFIQAARNTDNAKIKSDSILMANAQISNDPNAVLKYKKQLKIDVVREADKIMENLKSHNDLYTASDKNRVVAMQKVKKLLDIPI
jgi:hypothetical protein